MTVIQEKLEKLEEKHDVEILYACESGSRVWGFENDESDFDIRFIYRKKSLKDYLTILPGKDTIEENDGLYDFSGWDIKKAFFLHYKSNPSLREWLISNIVYIPDVLDIFKNLPEFDISVLKHHYTSMLLRHLKKYKVKNRANITANVSKKYCYMIRCVLSWIVLDNGGYPPINIFELIKLVDLDLKVKENIFMVINSHKDSDVLDFDLILFLNDWFEKSLKSMKEHNSNELNQRDVDVYNNRFYELIASGG